MLVGADDNDATGTVDAPRLEDVLPPLRTRQECIFAATLNRENKSSGGRVIGQQPGSGGAIASSGDRHHQRGLQTHQRGQELTLADQPYASTP